VVVTTVVEIKLKELGGQLPQGNIDGKVGGSIHERGGSNPQPPVIPTLATEFPPCSYRIFIPWASRGPSADVY